MHEDPFASFMREIIEDPRAIWERRTYEVRELIAYTEDSLDRGIQSDEERDNLLKQLTVSQQNTDDPDLIARLKQLRADILARYPDA